MMNIINRKAETLPPNWEWMELGNEKLIPQARIGSDKATENLKSTIGVGVIPLIHSGDLLNEKSIKTGKYVTEETYYKYKQSSRINIVPGSSEQSEHTTFTNGTIASGKGTVLLSMVRRGVGNLGILDADRAMYNHAVYAMKTDPDVLLPDLLFYFLKKADIQAYLRADLKAGRQYISVNHVKALVIPFPKECDQQERLVKRIEGLLSQVKAAQRVVAANREYIDTLLTSILQEVFTNERMREWNTGSLTDLVTFKGTQDLNQLEYTEVPWIVPDDIDPATAFLTLQRGRVSNTTQPGVALARNADALIYAAEKRKQQQPARLAMPYRDLFQVCKPSPDLLRCDADFSVFTVNNVSKLHPRFLFWSLLLAQVRPAAKTSHIARGARTNALNSFKASTLAYPDLAQQERISAYLDSLQEKLISMKMRQVACQISIEQMENSILDQAFRGAL